MEKEVLVINDLAGYGKVALSAMIPVLSKMGVRVHNLPTALVSNTLDYGKFHILDTTEYMKNTIAVWKELGFHFDAVSTGFLVNGEQADLVASYVEELAENGVTVFCDPIMGDDGHLYPGMGEETIANMRKLVAKADYVLPNYTEAAFLCGKEAKADASAAEIRELIEGLREMGAGSVIITSAKVDGQDMVCGYDALNGSFFEIPFDLIPVRFPGTGDIFSSVLTGCVLNGISLKASVAKAMNVVRDMMSGNVEQEDKFAGLPIEACLKEVEF